MMQKLFLTTLLTWMVMTAKADEGMLLLSMLQGQNMSQMQKMGLTLSAEEIYSVNHASLKDAVIGLGNESRPFMHFCSGEIISNKGLFTTNYHCGFSEIQRHTTLEHNYLENGFWAYKTDDELTCDGITASILERMENVTDRFYLPDSLNFEQRNAQIDSISNLIETEAVKNTNFTAQVIDMFEGNQFYLFVYTIYRDVRLVGAPPQSLGKFGGDTDNWSWPRHTCDFSMFRIYTAPDGSPAAFDSKNIPLKPKHVFPVSAAGIKEGDFTMIMGFPGSTDRFATSYTLNNTINENNIRYNIRSEILGIMDEGMSKSEQTRIQYASKRAKCSNYWKYSYEQNKALEKLRTIDHKKALESQFQAWVDANKQRKAQYSNVLNDIAQGAKNIQTAELAINYLSEALLAIESPIFAYRTSSLIEIICNDTTSSKTRDLYKQALRQKGEEFYKDFDAGIEQQLYSNMIYTFTKNVPADLYPDFIDLIQKKYKSNCDLFSNNVIKKSIFTDKNRFFAFVEKPNIKTLSKDLAYVTGLSFFEYISDLQYAISSLTEPLSKAKQLFVKGLLEMNPEKGYCPDANSTLRLSFGNVKSYTPRDAVFYNYYTTFEGIFEKEGPKGGEFEVPQQLKELFKKQNFEPYGSQQLNINFLTNNDITGGNSGSPVINGKGELVGLAFDGNCEAMSGDIDFEENMQRCIVLDTRYMLYIIDKYAGAQNLIDEINIVK